MRWAREEVIRVSYVAAECSAAGRVTGIRTPVWHTVQTGSGSSLNTGPLLSVHKSCTVALPRCDLRRRSGPSLPGVELGYPGCLDAAENPSFAARVACSRCQVESSDTSQGSKIPQIKGTVLPPSGPTCLVGPSRVCKN